MKILTFVAALCLAMSHGLQAQTPAASPSTSDEVRPNFPAWTAELPGGKYMVALRAILSISSHEYLVDGAARVTEVNIATAGDLLARFYHIEPVATETPMGIGQSAVTGVLDKLGQAGERAGTGNVWERVVKNYPTTTHARTVEFRLESKEDVEKLYQSVENTWKRGKTGKFTVK